ncbi:hypothetical protein SPRG_06967 [Saprolegnia parasitica CBS 223.65]|uniref:FAD-binding FR-type domain-containing protein n=1 Tax=Saprolegnia parasitica (strain CBS 223.65) TaxID=695850 RepID=A0A067CDX0_SAPPC|nr:hypothetical protein SPRG_06967 [Saprolegnia parasitica CBS 223.65]KDO27380.1 hypothetical protein SPRG_06967 [Saprolegnia parasitica CBS 223.65]|eukprot:XP_012201820.1 hypothetical protein SPRG_06967 [Saprolegnia parasitica CBS 223.65]
MVDFAVVKTPRSDDETPTPTSSTALVLRLTVLLCFGIYIFGNIATWAPLFELQLVNTMTEWWHGYPNNGGSVVAGHHSKIIDTGIGRNITITGHTEFVRPTFLFLFCILPFFVGLLLIETLGHPSLAPRRATSSAFWRVAQWMRRKPSLFGSVSRCSLGEWLFGVVFVIGGNVLCFYYEWDRRVALAKAAGAGKISTTKYWNMVGISAAYLCIYNMAFLLLPVSRNSAWMEFMNISYANGAKLHRYVGYMTVLTGVVHTGGYWGKWVRDGTWVANQAPCMNCNFTDETTGYFAWFNFFGLVSVVALLLLLPTSIPIVRRKAYEWFYISHWVLFLTALSFAILHWTQILWWILPSGLLFLIGRACSSYNALSPVAATMRVIGGNIVQVVLAVQSDYLVGHFVYLNVPAISKLQWHALTIASSAKTSGATTMTLLVKPVGDWSTTLLTYAAECGDAAVVFVDGFCGAALNHLAHFRTTLLVGGGIGVTPILAVLEEMAHSVHATGVWAQCVVLVFSARDLALFELLAPVLTKLRELDPQQIHFTSHLFLSTHADDNALDAPSRHRRRWPSRYERRPVAHSAPHCSHERPGANHYSLWPLQRAFELAVFTATILVVYVFLWAEAVKATHDTAAPLPSDDALPATIVTIRDLLLHLGVTVGTRPTVHALVADTLAKHRAENGVVGVIVSGPESLKCAVNDAAVALGAHFFDIHEEEFEL